MSSTTVSLPLSETYEPGDLDELLDLVAQAYRTGTPVYPIGGGTSLDYGLPAKQEGWGLSLGRLTQVIDYPARDMTVTLQAGATMQALAELLAEEGQQLPVDVPHPPAATIGGVIATNFNGPRRLGYGAIRDQVIGIQAVDGRGKPFKGGGRVVKNVAGYDFCKLLTGSLGTLGVITQVTLKLRPIAERTACLLAAVGDGEQAERHLAALIDSRVTPAAVELLSGPAWREDPALPAVGTGPAASDRSDVTFLAVFLEGTRDEVAWMRGCLADEWRQQGLQETRELLDEEAHGLLRRVADFPSGEAPLVLGGSVVPSHTTRLMEAARHIDPTVSLLAHAGNGSVFMRFSEFPAEGLARTVVGKLQAIAGSGHGHVEVLSNPAGAEMTHQSVWGGIDVPFDLMTEIKNQFDPRNVLNPGRFVYL